jgi:hypothetical protein
MGLSFSWGCNNRCDSSERWYLLRPVPSGHVFPSSYVEVFQMSTPIGGWVLSSMCQHGVRNEKALETFLFQFCAHFIGRRCQQFYNMRK